MTQAKSVMQRDMSLKHARDNSSLSEEPAEGPSSASLALQQLALALQKSDVQGPCEKVTGARFFHEFMADPSARNAELEEERKKRWAEMNPQDISRVLSSALHHPMRKRRQYDFRLDQRELDVFQETGFVVSERQRAQSFAEMYYRIYTDDLPVFVSADSVLHAWHRSFDAILNELEEKVLSNSIAKVLDGMQRAVPGFVEEGREVSPVVVQADIFLTVAIALLSGEPSLGALGAATESAVSPILAAVMAEARQHVSVFGVERETDFSMMKPRGRYSRTEQLQRYFRCVSWLGRADMRIPPIGSPQVATGRAQLSCALTLLQLANRACVMEELAAFDDLIQQFVGEKDCAGLSELAKVCIDAEVDISESDALSDEQIERVYVALMQCEVGVQRYAGDIHYEDEQLPRSICMMGQRFILDSWMLTSLVYDGKNGLARRVPSALDVALGAFGNEAALPYILDRMHRKSGAEGTEPFVSFRDGIDYSDVLVTARCAIDALGPEQWASSIYGLWMSSLRCLSGPHPWCQSRDCFGTPAWQTREMNVQLASWTQLRHDTVLYAKQGFTCSTCCEYPAGLVEPRPDFWLRMKQMSTSAANMLRSRSANLPDREASVGLTMQEELRSGARSSKLDSPKRLLASMATFLENFGRTMDSLHAIAQKQLDRAALSSEEDAFLKCVMEERHGSGGTRYLGWYPTLFYTSREDSGKREVLITDVHTDPADSNVGDPGCVVHEGVGDVHLMVVVADTSNVPIGESSADRLHGPSCYAGPVFSHYEILAPTGTRLTDGQWKQVLDNGSSCGITKPAHPVWTQPWLVGSEAGDCRPPVSC